jgi:hypothetical protein
MIQPGGKGTTWNNPTAETQTLASGDDYLYSCGSNPKTIQWERLTGVAIRTITRLLADTGARSFHLERLHNESGVLSGLDTSLTADIRHSILHNQDVLGVDRNVTLKVMLLLSDAVALVEMASALRAQCRRFWVEAMRISPPPFAAHDRDDRAAERLYELAKLSFC